MRTLFENKFIVISIDYEYRIFYTQWLSATERMCSLEYRKIVIQQIEIIKEICPKFWVIDALDLNFPIDPLLQQWEDRFFPEIKRGGLKYIAVVKSSNFVAQISLEQLFDEDNAKNSNCKIRYFEDKIRATTCLKGIINSRTES